MKPIYLILLFVLGSGQIFAQRANCGPMSYSAQMCAGSSQVISGTPISGATTYQWVLYGAVSGTYISSPTSSPTGTLITSSGQTPTLLIEVHAFNSSGIKLGGCGASIIVSSSVPSTPSNITWNGNLCLSQAKTYTCQDVGAPSYTWEVVEIGFTQTTATNQIYLSGTSFSQTGSYTLRVKANSGCGSSGWREVTIQVVSSCQEY